MIAFLGDTHFGIKSFNQSFFENQIKFYEEQFFPYLLKHNITQVIQTGDLWDNRNFMNNLILQQFKNRFAKWFVDNKVHLHTLLGNHDIYYKNTLDTSFQSTNLNEFSEYVHYYNTQEIIHIDGYKVLFVPWVIDYDDFDVENTENVDLVVGHFDLKGFELENNIISQVGFEQQDFEKYELVITGHYHKKTRKDNIFYIGSPYQLTWNDFCDDRGFVLLDKKYETTFIENTASVKHVRIYYTEKNGIATFYVHGLRGETKQKVSFETVCEICSSNFIKLIVQSLESDDSFDMYYKILLDKTVNGKLEIVFESKMYDDFDEERFLSETMKNEMELVELFGNFVNHISIPSEIKKSTLINLFTKLHSQGEQLMNNGVIND